MYIHKLLELADFEENIAAVSRVPHHTQLHRLPEIFMLPIIINSASELRVPVLICNVPTSTATVFYLPFEMLSHWRY